MEIPPQLMRWINGPTIYLVAFGFVFLRLIWSLGKVVFHGFKSPRVEIPENLDEKDRQVLEHLNEHMYPPSSKRTITLAIMGFVLGVGGGIGFHLAPDGTSPSTIGSFAALVIGIIMFLMAMMSDRNDMEKVRLASVLQPGAGWRVTAMSDGEELQTDYSGFPVRVRFTNGHYDSGCKVIIPAQTIVRFTLPTTVAVRLVLRRDAPWWGTDIMDFWAHLTPIESVSLDQLKLFGSPPEQAAALVSRWLRQYFEKWRKTVHEKFDLSLALIRLDGQTFEFHFEGSLAEPLLDEAPSLKKQLDEILQGCRAWCFSVN